MTSDEKNELKNKIEKLESEKNYINNELSHAVHIMKRKYPERLKEFEESKKSEFKESKEDLKKNLKMNLKKNLKNQNLTNMI